MFVGGVGVDEPFVLLSSCPRSYVYIIENLRSEFLKE